MRGGPAGRGPVPGSLWGPRGAAGNLLTPHLASQSAPSPGKFLPRATVPSPANEGRNQTDHVSYGEVSGAACGVNNSPNRFLPFWDRRVPQSSTVPCACFEKLIFLILMSLASLDPSCATQDPHCSTQTH